MLWVDSLSIVNSPPDPAAGILPRDACLSTRLSVRHVRVAAYGGVLISE